MGRSPGLFCVSAKGGDSKRNKTRPFASRTKKWTSPKIQTSPTCWSTWKRYSNGTGGDAITFLQTFKGKGFRDAVEYLLEFNGRSRDAPRPSRPRPPPENERPKFILPPANGDNRRMFACVVAKSALLRFRLRRKLRSLPCSSFSHRTRFAGLRWEPFFRGGIAPQVIRSFLNAGLLYEDVKYHNCVFVGRDRAGRPRFASKRGTASSQSPLYSVPAYGENYVRSLAPPSPIGPASLGSDGNPFKDGAGFKRDVLGSDKSVAFPLPCNPAIPWVLVFEAPIDLMSFCTLHREVRSNAVALCGLYPGALDAYLRDNPHLRHVVLCLDADGPGREAAEKLQAEYESRGLKVSVRTPARGKDWNEYLRQRGPTREMGR